MVKTGKQTVLAVPESVLRNWNGNAADKAVPMQPLTSKDTNPKDAVGTKKWRIFTTLPMTVMWELGVALLEGARKYGRHNYRVAGVRASVYVDAAMGHITQWWEGEDVDADSGLSHITKAMASLTVMRDAMIQQKFVDDRPPHTVDLAGFRDGLQKVVDGIFERHPVSVPAYVEGDQYPAPLTQLSEDAAKGMAQESLDQVVRAVPRKKAKRRSTRR